MMRIALFSLALLLVFGHYADAQRAQRGNQSRRGQSQQGRGAAQDMPENQQAIGDSGIAWYTTWETGLAEAKRSNRPIFFMAAATACSGVPGVF